MVDSHNFRPEGKGQKKKRFDITLETVDMPLTCRMASNESDYEYPNSDYLNRTKTPDTLNGCVYLYTCV
jgi:hypothetical protein